MRELTVVVRDLRLLYCLESQKMLFNIKFMEVLSKMMMAFKNVVPIDFCLKR